MTLQEIMKLVESEFDMGGLSTGLYADFAAKVANIYAKQEIIRHLDMVIPEKREEEVYSPVEGEGFEWNSCRKEVINKIKEIKESL